MHSVKNVYWEPTLVVRAFMVAVVVTIALLADNPRGAFADVSMDANAGLAPDKASVIVDTQLMRVEALDEDYAFSTPAPDVYRFEVRKDDFGWSGDKAGDNRRSELVSLGERYYSGETLWASFSFVVGPEHVPFDDGLSGHNQITQWHSVDTDEGRSPVFGIQLNDGDLVVGTRSDTNGPTELDVHYSEPRPADGVVHHVVVAGLLGKDGHLDVWLNGTQIVNVDTPIGYYNDDDGARGLAYPHWGIYQENVEAPAIVYLANIQWSFKELSARVAKPLPVAEPPGGWV